MGHRNASVRHGGRILPVSQPLAALETLEPRLLLDAAPWQGPALPSGPPPLQIGEVSAVAIDAFEPDDEVADASVITVDGPSQTHSLTVYDVDWVRFVLAAATTVLVRTSGTVGDTELWLYDASVASGNYTPLAYNDDYGTDAFSGIVASLEAGTYYAAVNELWGEEIAEYSLSVSTTTPMGPDAFEPDDQVADASAITVDDPPQMRSLTAGDVDWVRFDVAADAHVRIRTSGLIGDTELWLYDASVASGGSAPLAYNDDYGDDSFSRIVATLSPGTYYAEISEYSGDEIAEYSLSVDTIVPGDSPLIVAPTLEIAILEELDLPFSHVLDSSDLGSLVYLDASSSGIADLTGIGNAMNLAALNVSRNRIVDISPLADLPDLMQLDLWDNSVIDILPLADLTDLSELGLEENLISDISPLSGLASLTALGLSFNPLADISPLSGLTNLELLGLRGTQITGLLPLADLTDLIELDASANQIGDVSPLSDLASLEWLDLSDNQITDIWPVSGLSSLIDLYLEYNYLYLGPASPAMPVIEALDAWGAWVEYEPQNEPGDAMGLHYDLGSFGDDGTPRIATQEIGDGFFDLADVDLYRFEIDQGGQVFVDVDAEEIGSDLDPYLRLFSAAGVEIASDDNSDGLDPYLSPVLEAGTYYVGVSGSPNGAYDPAVGGSGVASDTSDQYVLWIGAPPTLTWDGTDSAEWTGAHWDPGPAAPGGGEAMVVDSGVVDVSADLTAVPGAAASLDIASGAAGGTVNINDAGRLSVTGQVNVGLGGTLNNDGVLTAGAVNVTGGLLTNSRGSAAPVTFGGDVALSGGGTFVADVVGAGVDTLASDGTVALGPDASLEIVPAGGGNEFRSGTYTLIAADEGMSGTFANVTGLGSYATVNGNGLTYNQAGGTVTLTLDKSLNPGDGNLDGATDVSDRIIWNNNNFTFGTTFRTGDFNGDGATDVSDRIIWNNNNFTFATAAPAGAPAADADDILVAKLAGSGGEGVTAVLMERGIDYERPGYSEDDVTEYFVEINGVGITRVQVTTPWGAQLDTADLLPGWTGLGWEEVTRGALECGAWAWGSPDGARGVVFEWSWLSDTQWAALDTGQTTISVFGSSGLLWSETLDFSNVEQHTREPKPTSPTHREVEPSTLTVKWPEWTDAPAGGAVWLSIESRTPEDEWTYEAEESLNPSATQWTPPPLPAIDNVIYESDITFVNVHHTTVNGAAVHTAAYTESDVHCVAGTRTDDHGNTAAQATPVAVPSSTGGNLSYTADIDFFSFSAVEGTLYKILIDTDVSPGLDTVAWLYADDGALLTWDDDGGEEDGSLIRWIAPANGTYFLAVDSHGSYDDLDEAIGHYSVRIGLDTLTPDSPTAVFSHPGLWLETGGMWGAAVSEEQYIGATGDEAVEVLHALNLSDPTSPDETGAYFIRYTEGTAMGPHGFFYYGQDDIESGFGVFSSDIVALDISGGGDPVEVYRTRVVRQDVDSLAIVGNLAYVGTQTEDHIAALEIYDLSDPVGAAMVGQIELLSPHGPGSDFDPDEVVVVDGVAYVLHDGGVLSLIDVRDPALPVLLDQFPVSLVDPEPWGLAVADGMAWIGVGNELHGIDVSDPDNPAFRSSIALDGKVEQILIHCTTAYVGCTSLGVTVVDVSDPDEPSIERTVVVPGATGSVALSGEYTFVPTFGDATAIFMLGTPLIWDGTDSAEWTGSHWNPGPVAPGGCEEMVVNSGTVNVSSDLTTAPGAADSLDIARDAPGGAVSIGAAGRLAVTGEVNVGDGGTLRNDGVMIAAAVNVTGGVLTNSSDSAAPARFGADVTLSGGGTFVADAVGAGVDTLVTDGAVALGPDASLEIAVSGGGNEFVAGTYMLIAADEGLTGTFANVTDLGAYVSVGPKGDGLTYNPAGTATLTLDKNLNPADGNLDGQTDVSDRIIWNNNNFTFDTTWATGDWNNDGQTDVSDRIVWNNHNFTFATAAPAGAPVPAALAAGDFDEAMAAATFAPLNAQVAPPVPAAYDGKYAGTGRRAAGANLTSPVPVEPAVGYDVPSRPDSADGAVSRIAVGDAPVPDRAQLELDLHVDLGGI